jgi:hypothetical protein
MIWFVMGDNSVIDDTWVSILLLAMGDIPVIDDTWISIVLLAMGDTLHHPWYLDFHRITCYGEILLIIDDTWVSIVLLAMGHTLHHR